MSNKKIITYVGPDETAFFTAQQLCKQIGAELKTLNSIHELFPLLSDPKYSTDLVIIDIERFYDVEGANMFDVINTVSTLISCTVCRRAPGKPTKRTTIMAAATDITTDSKLIKEVLGTEIKGIYPRGAAFSLEEKELALNELLQGHYHVPTKISTMFNKKKKTLKVVSSTNKIFLTPRQEQIANLVSTRGSSNKVIARTLGISESTVKLHMGAILKKYGVKNRTQLAVFSKASTHEV